MRKSLNLDKQSNREIKKALQTIQKHFESKALHEEDKLNFKGTADRVARMYEEIYWEPSDIVAELIESLNTTFPVGTHSAGMIVHGPVTLNSMCPHHFMPVRYEAYLGIIPEKGGRVLGTSKMDRVPDALSRRFVLQEQLAKDIADVLYKPERLEYLKPNKFLYQAEGAICTLIGIHTCEACRGIKQDARTMVTERRGSFDDNDLEARFFSQISILNSSKPFGK